MPEDSQAQPDLFPMPPPVEQATPAPEAPMPAVTESTAPIEPTQAPREPIEAPPVDTQTAQIPASKPLSPEPVVESAPPPAEPFDDAHGRPSVPLQELQPPRTTPVLPPTPVSSPSTTESLRPSPKSFLAKALASIQFRKKAKLEKIVTYASEKGSITNDQVQKLLRVSDATATRYLSELVRQARLRRLGIRGSARYEPIIGSIPPV